MLKDWKKGDRIAAFVHGGNLSRPEDGKGTKTSIPKETFDLDFD